MAEGISKANQADPLTRAIIGEAMHVHRVLGPGFLESIYHHALLRRLQKRNLRVESQRPLSVYFEGEIIGDFLTDMIVEQRLILELKAVASLNPAHEVQLVNYLTATKIDLGLLLNFGGKSLEVKRKSRMLDLSFQEVTDLASSNPVNLVNSV